MVATRRNAPGLETRRRSTTRTVKGGPNGSEPKVRGAAQKGPATLPQLRGEAALILSALDRTRPRQKHRAGGGVDRHEEVSAAPRQADEAPAIVEARWVGMPKTRARSAPRYGRSKTVPWTARAIPTGSPRPQDRPPTTGDARTDTDRKVRRGSRGNPLQQKMFQRQRRQQHLPCG